MATFNSVEYEVPAHWLAAIVNDDETGLDAADYAAYLIFCRDEVKNAVVEVISQEPYFSHDNDAGILPCDIVDCVFHYPTSSVTYQVEYTDTFGGEANYSWVKREEIELPETATHRQIVMAAKAAVGLTGVRCSKVDLGDCWALYPTNSNTVLFIT